ncbi:hypothetical protein [Parvibaculum sp.]|uniref:hypothetical protein n=1 Tax=Parvibaculum sp. TaxID=2024848 RepID=UPI00391D1832
MTDERQGGEEPEANRAARYKVGVGEDFPLLDEDKRGHMDMRVEWNCGRDGGWRRDRDRWRGSYGYYPLPRLVYVLAAVAGFIALISLAVSYPLATLGAVVVLLLLAGGPRRRRSFGYRDWDGPRRGRGDAA